MEKLLSVGLVFASQRRRTRRRIKSKCPSWRGEAPGRPRCQGRVVFAFIGAERETLDRRSGRLGAGFGEEGQSVTEAILTVYSAGVAQVGSQQPSVTVSE